MKNDFFRLLFLVFSLGLTAMDTHIKQKNPEKITFKEILVVNDKSAPIKHCVEVIESNSDGSKNLETLLSIFGKTPNDPLLKYTSRTSSVVDLVQDIHKKMKSNLSEHVWIKDLLDKTILKKVELCETHLCNDAVPIKVIASYLIEDVDMSDCDSYERLLVAGGEYDVEFHALSLVQSQIKLKQN